MTSSTRSCPACGSTGPHRRRDAAGKLAIGGGPLIIARCAGCGASFQPAIPNAEELARWYDYMGHNPRNLAVSPLVARRIARIVDVFADCKQTGRLLEVGCGGGIFIRAASAAGWETWGTEISPSCASLLRPLLAERLYEGSVLDAPFAAASFDGAAMVEVIEHLQEPDSYIDALRRLLRPGGRLFLTTPNASGSAARFLGFKWRAFTDEHLNYFTPSSLRLLLERHGFGKVRVTSSNLDLLALAAEQRHRWRRRRAPVAQAAAPATSATSSALPLPSKAAPYSAPDATAELRAAVADLSIEAINRFATATGLGDTLRVVAERR